MPIDWVEHAVIERSWPDLTDLQQVTRGGQRLVYRATIAGELSALKLFRVSDPEDDTGEPPDTTRKRLERELHILAGCQCPTLSGLISDWTPRVLHDPVSDRVFVAYAERWIAGPSVGGLIPMSADDVIAMALDMCEALTYLHGHGRPVLHRDIKPDNIVRSERFVLIDLGYALETGEERLTDSGLVVGTLGFMSPEQCTATADMDGRSDLFSLGVTIGLALTGEHPYRHLAIGGGQRDLQVAIANQRWVPSARYCATIPPALLAVVTRLLQRHRHQRYRDVQTLRSHIEPLAGGRLT